MYYKTELKFFCDTLRKKRIDTQIITKKSKMSEVFSNSFASFCDDDFLNNYSLSSFIPDMNPNTIYKLRDIFSLSFICVPLPEEGNESFLFIGPYASSQFTNEKITEICQKNKIDAKRRLTLENLLCNFTVVEENSTVFTMLDLLCETMWGTSDYETVDLNTDTTAPSSTIINEFDEVMVDMKRLEDRYQLENDLIDTVKNGHAHRAIQLLSNMYNFSSPKKASDAVRAGKNACIILNTLMRKAAENGGVHPLYLNNTFISFGARIERIQSLKEVEPFAEEIVRSYCRLVKKSSINNYSPLVQKAIVTIDTNMASSLSLCYLAKEQKVSPGYLSTIFKRETGLSVTEFIRDRRIKHAAHLLATTHLQIQSVAKQCGIPDVQYFSKTFKRVMGKPPKDYRADFKKI